MQLSTASSTLFPNFFCLFFAAKTSKFLSIPLALKGFFLNPRFYFHFLFSLLIYFVRLTSTRFPQDTSVSVAHVVARVNINCIYCSVLMLVKTGSVISLGRNYLAFAGLLCRYMERGNAACCAYIHPAPRRKGVRGHPVIVGCCTARFHVHCPFHWCFFFFFFVI